MSTEETEPDVNSKVSDVNSKVSNDNVHVEVTKKPHCEIKFDIKVKPQGVDASYLKAVKNINKEVSIPGFRKGRAPEPLIIERYQSAIQKEFVDLVLQTGFNEAVQLTHLHPLKDGYIKRPIVHECSRGKEAHFTIEFEARPMIPSVKVEDLQIRKIPPSPITDEDRQNALQNLMLRFATYEPIEDRPVQENDFIDVSLTILQEPSYEAIKKQRTQVNASGLPFWLRQKVIGFQAGESAEGMTEQDPNLSESNPDFLSVPFRVTVHAIWQGNLPALDEEFAKRVGLQSIEELPQKINDWLEKEARENADRLQIQALENLIVEKYPIDIPQSYINANKETRLEDYLQKLEKQKQDYTKEDYLQIEKMIEQNTIYDLQLFFLLRRIASDYNITVSKEDIPQELNRQVALIPSGRSSIDFSDENKKVHEQLHTLAFDHKIKQFLLDHVNYNES